MLRKLLAIGLAFYTSVAFAAQVGPRRALLNSSCPVVNQINGVCPAGPSFNFTQGSYWVPGQGLVPLTSVVSTTRASTATNLLPSSPSGFAYTIFAVNTLRVDSNGALIEESRHNNFLASTAPATQTVTLNNPGAHILWVNGSGSITMSAGTATGCGTGVATQGVQVSFNITAPGTCIFTVAGSLNAAQVERGAFGTSFIITTVTQITRAADVPQLIGPAATAALAAKSAFFQTYGSAGGTAPFFMGYSGTGAFYYPSTTIVRVSPDNGVTNASATLGSGTNATTVKAAFGMDATTYTAIANAGTQGSHAGPWAGNTGTITFGNRADGVRALNGYMQRFALSPIKGVFDGATAP